MTPAPDLPDDLVGLCAEQILAAADAAARAAVLATLVAAHPDHAVPLQRLCADLCGTERLLEGTYPTAAEVLPAEIGGYRVVRQLGEGAFGIVFLCAQEGPVVRQVAVKVLRPGAGDQKTIQRFAAERQLLAELDHPAITRIFDAGELPDRRPYFVMEYVAGTPIRAWCERHQLPCRDRLRLFVELCRGVAHAHARGIVHRDLKPANVLVADGGNGPVPKIIDFGVAKALVSAPGGAMPRTDAGRVIGTPGYMSPEQASGRVDEVDARADVFALGVMLYELLTGDLPWPRGPAATDTDPVRPSARVTTTAGATATSPSLRRQRAAELRGDLDWITLKALARERGDRYPTAGALADDIELHLAGRPVAAGPPSALYRLRKFVRRQRVAVASGSLCALTIAIAVPIAWRSCSEAVTSDEARVHAIAEAVARQRRRALEADAGGAPDRVTQGLLEDAMALYERELRERQARPELARLRLDLLVELAQGHHTLGQYRPAIAFAEEAQRQADDLVRTGADCRKAIALALREICRSNLLGGDSEKAHAAGAGAVAAFEQLYAEDPLAHGAIFAKALLEFATSCGRAGEAARQLQVQQRAIEVLRALAEQRPEDGIARRDLVRAHTGLANLYLGRQELDAAGRALREAEALLASPLVTDEERALVSSRLARFHAAKQEPGLAIPHAERSLELTLRMLERQPDRQVLRVQLVRLRGSLVDHHARTGDVAGRDRHVDALVAMPVAGVAELRHLIAETLFGAARGIVDAMSVEAFARAAALLERASLQLAGTEGERARVLGVRIQALLGHASSQLRRPWPAVRWREIAAAAEATAQRDWAGVARLHACRLLVDDLDLDAAHAEFAAARQLGTIAQQDLDAAELALALAEGSAAATASTAERLLENAPSVSVRISAAIALARAAAPRSDGAPAPQAEGWRQRAIGCCRAIVAGAGATPEERLARVQAQCCLATLLGCAVARAGLPSEHLPALDQLRGQVPDSWWNEFVWLSAHVACLRRELETGRAATAPPAWAEAVAQPHSAAVLLDLGAACVSAPTTVEAQPTLRALALDAISRAVDSGLRGRNRVLARADLAPLHGDATFHQLVARIPD